MKISNTLRIGILAMAAAMEMAMTGGCSHDKSPQSLAADVAAAKESAAKQVADARIEAGKGVKSVRKTNGGSDDVARARAIGEFDIAMAQADGDHSIALKECQSLSTDAQAKQIAANCMAQADAAYETAKQSAKDARQTRVARR